MALAFVALPVGCSSGPHDFSQDFLVGKWHCVDDPPRRVVQNITYTVRDGGRRLEEESAISFGGRAYGLRQSVIAFDGHRFTWAIRQDPTHGFWAANWFENGRLQLIAVGGLTRITFVERGPNALVVFLEGTGAAGSPANSVSRCKRTAGNPGNLTMRL